MMFFTNKSRFYFDKIRANSHGNLTAVLTTTITARLPQKIRFYYEPLISPVRKLLVFI